ncbi:dipeptidyl-peptidase 3 family protein [Sediminitomix flava]|uniref:Peptidase M49-like protein n=1 Tax=Sediminitomix flava TaxID=379075 RepID=A0A315Z9A7_SEDFL|nr:Zn-dependent hydrolase [Sediminitomix flava]PWJ40999.1 peptidase M49-like protein [Sediminitomix flava]
MKPNIIFALMAACGLMFSACSNSKKDTKQTENMDAKYEELATYADFTLKANLSQLSDNQKKMIPLMIDAAKIMDELFWRQAYGDKETLLGEIKDPVLKQYAEINYGPWDRLNGNEPFLEGVGPKPKGAKFYPLDMTKSEFDAFVAEDKLSLYTIINRNDQGLLESIPYSKFYEAELQKTAELLRQAAELAESESFKTYLSLRADALLSNEYFESDMAWMSMRDNKMDLVIGPIENYEDKLYGAKAAFEAYVLIKDMEWSKKLEKYASFLPELQKGLPADEKYKQDEIGTDSDLGAYDIVYYAGDCNAGSKTIAINLPNDEKVQQQKGTRRVQLKNAMQAKFEKIMAPISEVLIDPSQRQHVTFDAFFANTMFHEVAHGLGIKNTITGKGTVRDALKEHSSALEEGKADILGLYMVQQLHQKGEVAGDMKDYYTTFLAGIFRSVRFGAASAHGVANMIRFNFFKNNGAFERNADTGLYKVNYEKMEEAMNALSRKILQVQGDGSYEEATEMIQNLGIVDDELQADLEKLGDAGIPTDIVFQQGVKTLGL